MGDTNAQRALEEGKKAFCQGEPGSAAKYFRAAVTAEPSLEPGWRYLGFALNADHRPSEAVPAFEKSLALDYQDAEAHFGLVLALAQMGNDSRALAECEKVYNLQPDHRALHNMWIGLLLKHTKDLMAQGNLEWAKKYLDRAMEIDKSVPEIAVTYIEYACKTDDHHLAVHMINHLEEIKPDYPDLMRMKDEFGMLKERERGWLY